VDGHDVQALVTAFENAKKSDKPTAIVAQTYKGRGFPDIENKDNWHGKPLGAKSEAVIAHLQAQDTGARLPVRAPTSQVPDIDLTVSLSEPPNYTLGAKHATRQIYGDALVKLGKTNPRVIGLDGDTKNSTFSDTYRKAFPDRFIECFIAEQNLVGVAIGAGCRGRTIPFVSTFASFFTRTFDQIRMGAISQANIKCVGSHCGVSIGEDGPSQMALEDIGMFRSIPGCTVFYPADAVAMERSAELAAQTKGIAFIRTSRPATPVIYANDHKFAIGKANVVKSNGAADKILLIGAGVTLYEALNAAETLQKQHGISARVLDLFTIKPIDAEAIIKNAREVGGNIVTVEDHYPEGGVGEAVASAVAGETNIRVTRLAVRDIPRSGPADVLIDMYGIGARSVIETVRKILA
jgi:transketolase